MRLMDAVWKRVIKTPDDAHAVWVYLKEYAKQAVLIGTPLQVIVSRYRATRSNEQNAYMWVAVLTPAAEQVTANGTKFSPETWNEYLKMKFLPETCAKGIDKWLVLPGGDRVLRMSTSDLDVSEMTLYLEECTAHLASEYGVRFLDLEH